MTLDFLFIRNLAMVGCPVLTIGGALATGYLLRRGDVTGSWLRSAVLTLAAWVAAVPILLLSLFILYVVDFFYSAYARIWSDPGAPRPPELGWSDLAWFTIGLALWALCVAVASRSWWQRGPHVARAASIIICALITAAGPCLAIGCWFTDTRAEARMGSCGSNLETLSIAVEHYRKEHNGAFPPSEGWREALRSFPTDDVLYRCPSRPDTSYVYTAPAGDANLAEQRLIVCEHGYLHRTWVLFADGSLRSYATRLVAGGAVP